MSEQIGNHKRVWEYDGAYRCLDCKAQWGALTGHPTMPELCKSEPIHADKPSDEALAGFLRAVTDSWGPEDGLVLSPGTWAGLRRNILHAAERLSARSAGERTFVARLVDALRAAVAAKEAELEGFRRNLGRDPLVKVEWLDEARAVLLEAEGVAFSASERCKK